MRFVLEVEAGSHPEVWIQATTESRPIGWVDVRLDGRRIALEPMCAVADCDAPDAGVCGAGIPTVRRVAAADSAGSVAYRWDGTMSEIAEGGCERRVAAPAGTYTARICHASEVSVMARAEPMVAGRLVGPTCVERTFRPGRDHEVVVRIP